MWQPEGDFFSRNGRGKKSTKSDDDIIDVEFEEKWKDTKYTQVTVSLTKLNVPKKEKTKLNVANEKEKRINALDHYTWNRLMEPPHILLFSISSRFLVSTCREWLLGISSDHNKLYNMFHTLWNIWETNSQSEPLFITKLFYWLIVLNELMVSDTIGLRNFIAVWLLPN